MNINSSFVTGVDKLENEFYNVILPFLIALAPNSNFRKVIEDIRTQTIGDYINSKNSPYNHVLQELIKDRAIPKELVDSCLIITVRKDLYERFFKYVVMNRGISPKGIDFRTSGSACMIFQNPTTAKQVCIIFSKDMSEMIKELKDNHISIFHSSIPVELAVKSILLHELVHAQDYLTANGFRKTASYKNWREKHAYSVQFEYIDRKLNDNVMQSLFGTKSYNTAAEKFLAEITK